MIIVSEAIEVNHKKINKDGKNNEGDYALATVAPRSQSLQLRLLTEKYELFTKYSDGS